MILIILSIILFEDLQMAICLNGKRSADSSVSNWDKCIPTNKVVGGDPINIKEAPFILQVQTSTEPYKVGCGAVILSENVALTAAHCISSVEERRLTSGNARKGHGNVHYINKVIKHRVSLESPFTNDIALVFIKGHFNFSDSVKPIKLPTRELEVGTLADIAGYGDTKVQEPRKSNYDIVSDLRRVAVPIMDRKTCNAIMKKRFEQIIDFSGDNIITDAMVCAGYPGGEFDACKGDSGGPLYLDGVVYGIVSWGFGCALQCSPHVYANVYTFRDWIKQTMEDNLGN